MFCKNCGTEFSEEFQFCPQCGTQRAMMPPASQAAPEPVTPPEQDGPPTAQLNQSDRPVEEISQPQKKKSKKKLVLALTAGLTALALGLGIGGWFLLKPGKETVYVCTALRAYDANGINTALTSYEYDERGRLLKYSHDLGIGQEVWDEVSMIYVYHPAEIDGIIDSYYVLDYDDHGNLTHYEYSRDDTHYDEDYEWDYDGDKVEEMVYCSGQGQFSIETEYQFTYDRDGNLTDIYYTHDGEDRYTFKMEYDNQGRLTREIRMTIEGDLIFDFFYNEDGQVEEYICSRGIPAYNVYGKLGELSERDHLYLTYGNDGELLEVTDSDGNTVYEFTYDRDGRLIRKTENTSYDGEDATYKFSYDGDRPVTADVTAIDYNGQQIEAEYLYDENGCLSEIHHADGSYTKYEYKELTLSEEDAQWYHRQQTMLLRRHTSTQWAYPSYASPFHYLIPTPLPPDFGVGPRTE